MQKYYGFKTFEITDGPVNTGLTVECQAQNTRYGFRHLATLYRNGREIAAAKCCYYNRTWEAYEYQSVIQGAISNAHKARAISDDENKAAQAWANKDHTDWRGFRAIAAIAKIGEIMAPDQKSANDWKARMLKAGLEGRGLIMPEDWDQLSEDEKTRRLNGVIAELSHPEAQQ